MQILLPQLLALGLSLGIPDPHTIVGGVVVEPVDPIAASTVLLLKKDPTGKNIKSYCSGSLITPELVITAAHCVHETTSRRGPALPPERFFVYPEGTLDGKLHSEKIMAVAAVVSHPRFTADYAAPSRLHDLALLKLTSPAPATLRPANLLPLSQNLQENENTIVAGYGATLNPKETGLLLHKYVGYQLNRFQRGIVRLKGRRNRGSYNGDSGGPAFVEENGSLLLWGVFSCFLFEDGTAHYSDLRYEKEWLEQAATQMGASLSLL